MSVYQINLFVCEVCGTLTSTLKETSMYDDPVVDPPKGEVWGYTDEDKFACPKCLNNSVDSTPDTDHPSASK